MVEIVELELSEERHREDFLKMLQVYASDIMGGGNALSDTVQANLLEELRKIPHKLLLLAYDGDEPVGIANCFYGFSTFKAKPLLNIHDFAVAPSARGKGVALAMLQEIEKRALAKGCCKITLEVLEGNKRAQKVYFDFGFSGYELDPEMGKAIFLDKSI